MEKREQWGSRAGFILAAIGSAVGLGNIWRYPYVAYENGGGAFLIPYLFALLTTGITILILEYAIGYRKKGSPPSAFFRLSQRFEWLGWWQMICSFVVLTYYIVVVSWSFSFAYFSFGLKWGDHTERFMLNHYLKYSEVNGDIWNIGGINGSILIVLTAIWLFVFFVLFRGVKKGIEKANKLLLPLLILMLFVITIRGITLPGAEIGLNTLFEPNWIKIADPQVWLNAYGQIFFSLSIGYGVMITYSSYLPKRSDLSNNALIVAFTNSSVEFLAAIAVFGALGFLATINGVQVEEVVQSGIVLAFVIFPQIINQLPAFNEWFGLFFFGSLFVAGITSVISMAEVCVSALQDKFALSRHQAVSWIIGGGFVCSILYTTNAGLGYLDLVDRFINNYSVILAGLLEVMILGWVFKLSVFREFVNNRSDLKIGVWWDFCIKVITPSVLLFMLVYNLYQELFVSPYGNGAYTTGQLILFGWSVVIAVIVFAFLLSRIGWINRERFDR